MPSFVIHALRDTLFDPVTVPHQWMAWYAVVWFFLAGFVYILLIIDYTMYLQEQDEEDLDDLVVYINYVN